MFDELTWQSHQEYLNFLHESKISLTPSERSYFRSTFGTFQTKLKMLNLDSSAEYLKRLYPAGGRPARYQAQILRSMILHCLMISSGLASLSLTKWVSRTRSDKFIAMLIGCTNEEAPGLGSYYDLMDRMWLDPGQKDAYSRSRRYLDNKNLKPDPRKNPKRGSKAPDTCQSKTQVLEKKLLQGQRLTPNYESPLQELFYRAAVLPSIEAGLIDKDHLVLCGDGTCIHVHASPYGHRILPKEGMTPDPRYADSKYTWKHYADPDATWGYDSDLGCSYYGFTLYHLSCYSKKCAVDLPITMKFTAANRHDSVNLFLALDEYKAHTPGLRFSAMCLDSAHDNYATYDLIEQWDAAALIDLNGRAKNTGKLAGYTLDDNGVPLCAAGLPMYHSGFDKFKHATKWRCPLAVKGKPCPCACSSSKYGRTIYIKTCTDLRLFPRIARGTEKFNKIYSNRTTCERINARILHNYKLENMNIHNRKHYSFFTTCIGICLHLDARYKADPAQAVDID